MSPDRGRAPAAPGGRCAARLALTLVLAAAAPAAARAALSPDLLLHGQESAAYPDGPTALLFNPAAAGTRYPSELSLAWLDRRGGPGGYRAALAARGLSLAVAGSQDATPALGLGLAGGRDALRVGFASNWLPRARGGRAADHRLGLLSRPTPWASIGAVVDHATQEQIDGRRFIRDYTLGLALRPLAFSRADAHTRGARLTLTADAEMAENQRLADARYRFGGEVEVLPGIALRGLYLTKDRGFQLGISLLGVNSGYQAQAGYASGGAPRAVVHSLSFHSAEDRTVLAGLRRRRVAVIRVGGVLGDEALSGITLFGAESTTPAAPIHRQLERALEDPLTRGVLLDVRGVGNMAQLEELRARVRRLREAGKPVVAYLEDGGGRPDFYLASACDRVVTTPEAFFYGLGLRAERRYYRKLLADWGVRIDRTSYGKYKSAFRNFSVDSIPPADREAIEHNLDVVQEEFVKAVTADRGIDRARLMPVLDGRHWPPADLQKAGLVDSIGYREDALRILGRLAGLGVKPPAVRLARRTQARRDWTVPTRIAVVYAAGAIVSGKSGSDLLMGPSMGSETMVGQIRAAFRNPAVEAVVVRVESPGGSSVASDVIAHEIEHMKRETGKPVVVSMGGVAASGGYNISVPGDYLLADRFTVTGSIGVLLVKPSLEGWYAKHDVRQEAFQRGRYMGGWSYSKNWTPEMQAAADSATYAEYRDFVSTVAKARRLPWEDVDRVAQGRAWFGADALDRHLVDGIGGLEEAIHKARELAGIPEGEKIRVAEYRRPRPALLQRLVGSMVRETWESSFHMPAPGEMLYWMTEDEAVP